MRSLFRIAGALVLVCVWTKAPAQAPEYQNVGVDSTDYPGIVVEFEVRTSTGELLETLNAENVAVLEEGIEKKGSLRRAGDDDGRVFVMVVDTSGSMRDLLPTVRGALGQFVGGLGPRDQVGVVTFNDDVTVLVRPTYDTAEALSAVESVAPGGKTTELFFAIFESLKLLETPGLPGRKYLVVVSDGRDEGTAYTLDDCIDSASANGVNVLGLAVPSADARWVLNVRRLSELTGGRYFEVREGQPWADKVDSLRRHVDARWRFTWQTGFPADGGTHEAELRVTLDSLAISEPLRFSVAQDPILVRNERLMLWWVIGGAALFVAAIALIIVAVMRKRGARLRREIASAKGELSQKIGEVEEKLTADSAKASGDIVPAADSQLPSTAKPRTRKTLFWSGRDAEIEVYRNGVLEIIEGPLAGSRLTLPQGRTSVGREDDNQMVLLEDRVSRYHFAIDHIDGRFWVEDLGSANGTVLDERDPVLQRTALLDGTRIRAGGVLMVFHGER